MKKIRVDLKILCGCAEDCGRHLLIEAYPKESNGAEGTILLSAPAGHPVVLDPHRISRLMEVLTLMTK